ncbi:MAG TPA: tRNA 2-selenouridine(34) synthase MnmH [Firmicutes bacterium]|nr:tRNA 2-selenouridine(34) synthase MnmH [Bacillota bacterium]
MYTDIDVKTVLALKNRCFIDVRSPAEFAEGSIPGAVNVPLLDDNERHLVGITYRQKGAKQAKLDGLKIVAPKLPALVDRILEKCQEKKPVIFCWRGGMRSQAVASVLELVGIKAFRLQGGYKAFRRFILDELAAFNLIPELVVLDGLTGVGKTLILKQLQARGHPVLDLESLAGHRGSVFGGLGGQEKRGQKVFDALLWEQLQGLNSFPYLLVEAESRRIGQVFLPEFLFAAIGTGKRIKVVASLPVRVRRIVREYTDMGEANMEETEAALDRLVKRLGKRLVAELKLLLREGNLTAFVEILLKEYYDPLYRKSQLPEEDYELIVQADDLPGAVAQIENYLRNTFQGNSLPARDGSMDQVPC